LAFKYAEDCARENCKLKQLQFDLLLKTQLLIDLF